MSITFRARSTGDSGRTSDSGPCDARRSPTNRRSSPVRRTPARARRSRRSSATVWRRALTSRRARPSARFQTDRRLTLPLRSAPGSGRRSPPPARRAPWRAYAPRSWRSRSSRDRTSVRTWMSRPWSISQRSTEPSGAARTVYAGVPRSAASRFIVPPALTTRSARESRSSPRTLRARTRTFASCRARI